MNKTVIAILAIALIAGAGTAAAQTTGRSVPFGVRAGLSFDPDQFHVGAHAEVYEFTEDLTLVPNVEIGFGDEINLYAFNAEVVYSFYSADLGGFTPYAGAGLGFNYLDFDADAFDSESKLVLNMLAGISKTLDTDKELFFEVKIGPSDWTPDMKLTAGLTFF